MCQIRKLVTLYSQKRECQFTHCTISVHDAPLLGNSYFENPNLDLADNDCPHSANSEFDVPNLADSCI